MMERQRHRGPDGSGVWQRDGDDLLGHVRLSIIDPQHGQQPICSEDDALSLVANGEVYNHRALRAALRDDHTFRSGSDSETVLHVFEEAGAGTAELMDGAFAVAVAGEKGLYLARDPVGIKPLYVGEGRGADGAEFFCFASELKAFDRRVTTVCEFPPGSIFDNHRGYRRYYTVPRREPVARSLPEATRAVRRTLEDSIEKRLMSDVPLGAFLSGGLDSSVIAAIARRKLGRLQTFAVGIAGSGDLEAARRVARHIGSDHHEYAFTLREVREALPEVVYYLESYDQDLVRSAIPCYFCSRLAAQHVKVILTGEGADELFAGYGYYQDIKDANRLHASLRQSIEGLHNVNLQRVDRLTMRHSIEGRVPFLDTEMIALAQTIPPAWKLWTDPQGTRVEKWILRRAVEDLLPADIVWRAKEQFDEGSGTVDLLDELVRDATRGGDWEGYRRQHPQAGLRSAEECLYHQFILSSYRYPEPVLQNIGRWTGGLGAEDAMEP